MSEKYDPKKDKIGADNAAALLGPAGGGLIFGGPGGALIGFFVGILVNTVVEGEKGDKS